MGNRITHLTLIGILLLSVGLTSCQFTEECDYRGIIHIKGYFRDLADAPQNTAVKIYTSRETVSDTIGDKSDKRYALHEGNCDILSYSYDDNNLNFRKMHSADSAFVEAPVNYTTGVKNPIFPKHFFRAAANTDISFTDSTEVTLVLQELTKFVRIRYNIVQNNTGRNIGNILSDISGIGTRVLLKSGEGDLNSQEHVFVKSILQNNKVDGNDVWQGSFSSLSLLPNTGNGQGSQNKLHLSIDLDNGNTVESSNDIDLTEWFDSLSSTYATARVDVYINNDGATITMKEWNVDDWNQYDKD